MIHPSSEADDGLCLVTVASGIAANAAVVTAVLGRPLLWVGPNFAGRCAGVVGWGMRQTRQRLSALALAERRALPYWSLEDAPLRSVTPGAAERPLGVVVDTQGMFFDARRPSDFADAVARQAAAADPARRDRARAENAALRQARLSKYNSDAAPIPSVLKGNRRRVLVVDQTLGDAAVGGALADDGAFRRMLDAARDDHPGAAIVVKTHPEVAHGRKRGFLGDLARAAGVHILDQPVNPWDVLEAVDQVYVVASMLGFEALTAGKPVTCFGAPFYAGWGLTDDRGPPRPRATTATVEDLFAALHFDYSHYVDPFTDRPIELEEAIARMQYLRGFFLEHGDIHPATRIRRGTWRDLRLRLHSEYRRARLWRRGYGAAAAITDDREQP
jgi:capsular polysaccharide export protein